MTDLLFERLFGNVDEFKAETISELEEEYTDVSDELAYWLTIFATDKKLDWSDMNSYLTNSQLNRLKRYVGDNIQDRVRVKRIDAIELILENKLSDISNEFKKKLTDFETKLYEESYYNELYENQKEEESYWFVAFLLTPDILKIILKDWTPDKINFVERIGMKKDQLVDKLRKLITQTILRGESPDTIVEEVRKQFKISANQAKNIINTESTRVVSQASYDSMKVSGATEYTYRAILDDRTSIMCQDMNGRRFKITEYEIGYTAPPLHNHCRSYILWSVPANGTKDDSIKTYTDWFEKYIRK